jgi:hypothetical protein
VHHFTMHDRSNRQCGELLTACDHAGQILQPRTHRRRRGDSPDAERVLRGIVGARAPGITRPEAGDNERVQMREDLQRSA